MTLDDALETIGGLSQPDKMPCYSWSTPAYRCQLGSKLRLIKGSTCSGCYALKGMYVMPNVVAAMERRWAVLQHALGDALAGVEFVEAFAHVLNTRARSTRKRIARGQPVGKDGRYFRWHDAGDVQSVAHLHLIAAIATLCPDVEFWLPTREVGYVQGFLKEASVPPNLMIRVSLSHLNQSVPLALFELMHSGKGISLSGVHTTPEPDGAQACIAYTQDGHCRDCRACWDGDVPSISYPLH